MEKGLIGKAAEGGRYRLAADRVASVARRMGVRQKHVNELCEGRRSVTVATALILARVFGNSADFRLNVQRRGDLWEVLNTPRERERVERARPLKRAG